MVRPKRIINIALKKSASPGCARTDENAFLRLKVHRASKGLGMTLIASLAGFGLVDVSLIFHPDICTHRPGADSHPIFEASTSNFLSVDKHVAEIGAISHGLLPAAEEGALSTCTSRKYPINTTNTPDEYLYVTALSGFIIY